MNIYDAIMPKGTFLDKVETNYETGRKYVDRKRQNRRSPGAAEHRRRRQAMEKATKKAQRRGR